ncbi:MAG: hypothetical protein J0I20_28985 [Chloroflexi bacterium]|nr:hypothetical protein [Chloroflexota bacterium]
MAGIVFLFIWLTTPATSLDLLPGSSSNNLGLLNGETTIQSTGLTALPVNGGVTVAPGSQVRVTAFSFHQVTLNLTVLAGIGNLEIEVNGAKIGEIDRENLAGTYSFSFVPRPQDNTRPEMHFNFNLNNVSSSVVLGQLDLDFTEQWQPWLFAKNELALLLLAGLMLVVAGAAWLGRRVGGWWSWLALASGVAAVVLLATWLVTLLNVGMDGALNAAIFWGDLVAVFYLVIFIGGVGVLAVPVKEGASLFALVRPALVSFRAVRPTLSAALALVAANTILTGLLFLVPAVQNNGFDTLARYWDGPSYLAVAYSLYDPASPVFTISGFAQYSPLYWCASFPLVPLAIRLFSPLFGYVGAMFLLNFGLSCAFAITLYRFMRDFGYSRYPLWLSFVALFLPLRWLIYHSVGASEPAALFFTILCLYQFKKENYWWAGLWGAGVALARPNGFFLGIGLGLWLVWRTVERLRADPALAKEGQLLILFAKCFEWKALVRAILPMAGAVLAVFALYGWQTGDFLAYLHIPEDVTHLYPLPFLSLDMGVGRGEGDFYYYGLEAAGLVLLWQQKRFDLFWVGVALAVPAFFILHDDVLRYSLPAFPVVFLIPFAKVFESRPARWLAVPALVAVLVYSWSQLGTNQLDQASWRELLKFIG